MVPVSSQGQLAVTGSQTGSGSAKLTHDLLAKLVEKVESGLSISGCCKGVGISQVTYWQWHRDIPAFARAVDAAEERFEAKMLAQLLAHSKRDRHVTQWIMERRLRGDYGESQVSTVNHNHIHAVLPGEFLQSIVAARSTTDTKLITVSSESAGVIEAEVIPSETVDSVS